VKLAPGQPDTRIQVSIQRGLGSDTSYITVLGKHVGDRECMGAPDREL